MTGEFLSLACQVFEKCLRTKVTRRGDKSDWEGARRWASSIGNVLFLARGTSYMSACVFCENSSSFILVVFVLFCIYSVIMCFPVIYLKILK